MTTERPPLGIVQAEPGRFVVCGDPCPGASPKTRYAFEPEPPVAAQHDESRPPGSAAKLVPVTPAPVLTVHFGFDRAEVRPGDRSALRALAGALEPASALHIHGYTDDIGPEPYNRWLALARADAVAEVLAEAGIPRARIAVAGHPLCCFMESNEHPAGRAANRRAEIFVRPGPLAGPSKE